MYTTRIIKQILIFLIIIPEKIGHSKRNGESVQRILILVYLLKTPLQINQ